MEPRRRSTAISIAFLDKSKKKGTYSLIDVLTEKNDQIKTKDKIIQDQQGEIERLTVINAELEDKVKRLEQTQKSFDELKEEHIKILEEQTKQIEEKRDILSKLTGLVEG